jgi:WD40 repeat protein
MPEMRTATAAARVTPFPSPIPTLEPPRIEDSISPDGQWIARLIWEYLPTTGNGLAPYRIVFKVFKRDGTQEWVISDEQWQGLGYSTPRFLRWSEDSRYSYFDHLWFADGACIVGDSSGFSRLDVNDGSVTPVGNPVGFGHSFSPDESQLAYFYSDTTPRLVLYDLATGRERQSELEVEALKLDAMRLSGLAWSPDARALAFTASVDLDACSGQGVSRVVRVDVDTLRATKLAEYFDRLVSVVDWPEAGKIALKDWYGEWWIDAATGEVVPGLSWSQTSPDGEWIAELWRASRPSQTYTQLKVLKLDGSVEWRPIDEWVEDGVGGTSPHPFHWSAEGRYFYYINQGAADGCGTPFAYLQKTDLATGVVAQVIPEVWGVLGLSPDGGSVAYATYGDDGLELYHLETGEMRSIPLSLEARSEWYASNITWSPDGRAVIVTAEVDTCGLTNGKQRLVRVDLETATQTVLLEDSAWRFWVAEWPEIGRVVLKEGGNNTWWMDAETGALAPSATPTPAL